MVFKVKGCLCLSLKTGSNTIAVIGIIFGSIGVFSINYRNPTLKTLPGMFSEKIFRTVNKIQSIYVSEYIVGYSPIFHVLLSIILLIGANKVSTFIHLKTKNLIRIFNFQPDHRLMVPWMLLQAFITFFFTYIVLITHSIKFAWVALVLAYSLLVVWSFFIEVKEDAENNEADASIQFHSEPMVLDSHIFLMHVPVSAFKKSLPIDDLPPSYDSVVGTSAPPPSALS